MSKDIARAIERLDPAIFRRDEIGKYFALRHRCLFDHIYKEVYQGNLLNLLENRKRIRSGYLYFITEMIPKAR